MSDLISRKFLLSHECEADRMGAMLVVGKGWILEAPAVDAVEVVRCENCEHCELYVDYLTGKTFNFGYCYRRFKRRKSINRVNSDDYCSYGERRESEVIE